MDQKIVKILVADDSEAIHMTIRHMIMHDDGIKFTVFNAYNGKQANDIATYEQPDIILMDIQMPVMNGIEAVTTIKSNPLLSEIPVIIMSSTRNFAEAFAAGADDFILKPFNQYELLLRINLNIKYALKNLETKHKTAQLNAQKQEVIYQRDKIARQQNEIMQDLSYASFIQSAIMPDEPLLNEFLKSYFVYNRPKNIVSGDFYWFTFKLDWVIVAVGDCTGHGISGALMTMAGIAFLNEIVRNNNVVEPNEILIELRTRVIKLLNQKGLIGEASNGMDLALVAINFKNGEVKYAGANNPIYLVRKKEKLDIIKADRMPIGIHINHSKPFSLKEFEIEKGDIMYLFTDGYADQFGGPTGQKFRYNQFQELLLFASSHSMAEQQKILSKTMDDWKGTNEQVDDILIFGIEF